MTQEKVKRRDALIPVCDRLRAAGKTIGFTSGAFDLLHAGHVDYLEKAKLKCDVLVVGVNSDESVKRYKGEDRPLVPEGKRARIIAALEAVDWVFIFHERRNQKNIDLLRPDFYIKAGDYQEKDLTSKEIVEKYGGEVLIIPIANEISTSDLIRKIRKNDDPMDDVFQEREGAIHLRRKPHKQAPAIFLDRDGTINEDVGYLHDPAKLKLLPNALEGIRKLYDMGYHIIIMTNQPGIGIGYFSEDDFYRVNRSMLSGFSKAGILVDKIYFCPHSKSEACSCRKPELALVERATD